MNVQPNLRMDKAAFIEWSAVEEERYELVNGRVVMMPRPARAHAMIVMNLAMRLRSSLDQREWVVVAEFGLDAGPETLRYPDVVVDRAGGGPKDYTATSPVLLAEVLSPSSVETDLGDKAAEYLRIVPGAVSGRTEGVGLDSWRRNVPGRTGGCDRRRRRDPEAEA
jgi:Uma2 family endonuclease